MRLKHENIDQCLLCSKKLMDTCLDLTSWFLWVKAIYPNAHISWSFRGEEDQMLAYMKGASKLKWPLSKHNATDEQGQPYAKALDLFQLVKNKAVFDIPWYQEVYDKTLEQKLPINWGGTFKSIKDFDHYELIEQGDKDGF